MSDDFAVDVQGSEGSEPAGVEPQGQEPQGQQSQESMIPKQRFDQVYGKLKKMEEAVNQYKEFGDAPKLREAMQKLQRYEEAIQKYREQQSRTPQEQAEAQRLDTIRRELMRVMPGLEKLEKLQEMEEKLSQYEMEKSQSQAMEVLKDASRKFSDTLKASKIDLKYQDKIEDYVASLMSDEEKQEFVAGNYEIAESIFKRELEEGLFASLRKPVPPKPPLRNTPGGTPPSGQKQQAKSLADAADEGWSRISG